MDKTKIKYLYFDLDGTLLNNDHHLQKTTIAAIKKLQQASYKVGIISGRPDYLMRLEIAMLKPQLPLVAINGAKIINAKKLISTHFLDGNARDQIVQYLIKNQFTFLGYGLQTLYYYVPPQTTSLWVTRIIKSNQTRPRAYKCKLKAFTNHVEPFAKILVITSENSPLLKTELITFLNQFQAVYAVSSGARVLDIMPAGVSKGTALEYLARKQFINLNETIVFGDANNDLPMFKVAAMAVAMQNGTTALKKTAQLITKHSNDQNGVAKFIEEVIFNGTDHN